MDPTWDCMARRVTDRAWRWWESRRALWQITRRITYLIPPGYPVTRKRLCLLPFSL